MPQMVHDIADIVDVTRLGCIRVLQMPEGHQSCKSRLVSWSVFGSGDLTCLTLSYLNDSFNWLMLALCRKATQMLAKLTKKIMLVWFGAGIGRYIGPPETSAWSTHKPFIVASEYANEYIPACPAATCFDRVMRDRHGV